MSDGRHGSVRSHAAGAPVARTSADAVVFSEAAGVDQTVAASVLADAEHQVASSRIDGIVKRVRFVPSTRVEVDGGFQVLADTTVQSGHRSIVLGSVVTVEGDADHQTLKELSIRGLR